MARQAAIENDRGRRNLIKTPVTSVQFDDLITSLHTKCKPLSVSLAVDGKTREILGFQVSSIPARHPLTEASIRKYGRIRDDRPQGLKRLLSSLQSYVHPRAVMNSDCDPAYELPMRLLFPHAKYIRFKSRKGRTAGFGELKRIGYDPLFPLNHTCAMLRANLNRLARKTWATTKTKIGLILHLELYAHFHNSNLSRKSAF